MRRGVSNDDDAAGPEPATAYTARIGGLIYRNVAIPVLVEGRPLITLHRDLESDRLLPSFVLSTQRGAAIAAVDRGEVVLAGAPYELLKGDWGFSIIDSTCGRVWSDVRYASSGHDWEIDCSGMWFSAGGFPVILHPDRTILGRLRTQRPPNISGLTLTTAQGSEGSAIATGRGDLYLIDMAIENFRVGLDVRANG